MIRTAARKLASLLMAVIAGPIIAGLVGFGISPEDAQLVVDNLDAIVVVLITGAIYFGSELGLAKIKRFFPGDWAEQYWRTQAGEQVDPLKRTEAKRRIRAGQV